MVVVSASGTVVGGATVVVVMGVVVVEASRIVPVVDVSGRATDADVASGGEPVSDTGSAQPATPTVSETTKRIEARVLVGLLFGIKLEQPWVEAASSEGRPDRGLRALLHLAATSIGCPFPDP